MRLLLLGPGSDSFPAALNEAGIEFEKHTPRPPPGVIWAATGDVLLFAENVVPWASLATVLVAWIKARSARKIIVTTKAGKVIHAEGFGVEQFQQICDDLEEVAVIDLNKPDHK